MRTRAAIVAVLVLTAGATAGTAGDLTVDAVTRATELNPSVGSLTALTDGRVPETDPDAPTFGWDVAGFLVVEWDHPVTLEKIRIYRAQMDRYAYYGYLGGSFSSTGQRVGVATPLYSREGVGPVGSGWFEVTIRGPVPIDNMGIQFTGGALLYEIQFLGPDGTAVTPTSLGLVKQSHGR